jgi:UDP-N-acetylglucosamine/UDP-N-acetylgalactosamine diphosphorylase
MDFQPKSYEKIRQLLDKGVDIPSPMTIDIGDEVNVDQISGKGVKIYPGCRIYGSKTVISSGSQLGYEAPVTIEDCQLGSKVELKGGFFSKSVFLEKANMGLGAHVREGCILEEQAGGAHCVGLKQTILFPFVTLGSLINFCDCLMAGGTGRQNHSEVGSSYIHFNFTPDADKTTPSLIGDVPRGVMLNQPPIFLGGQGGIIGPLRMGYGNVVAAGSILRHDYTEDNKMIFEMANSKSVKEYVPAVYPNIGRIVENNVLYMANLMALEAWYTHVRKPFFEAKQFGILLYAGVMDQLFLTRNERLKRLKAMAEKAIVSSTRERKGQSAQGRREFNNQMGYIEDLFGGKRPEGMETTEMSREAFLKDFEKTAENERTNYIGTIQNLPVEISSKGVIWLSNMVDAFCKKVTRAVPSLKLFKK